MRLLNVAFSCGAVGLAAASLDSTLSAETGHSCEIRQVEPEPKGSDGIVSELDCFVSLAYRQAQTRSTEGGAFSAWRRFLEARRNCEAANACVLRSQLQALERFRSMGASVDFPDSIMSSALAAEALANPDAPASTLQQLLQGLAGDSVPRHDVPADPMPLSSLTTGTAEETSGSVGDRDRRRAALLVAPPGRQNEIQIYAGDVAWSDRSAAPSLDTPILSGRVRVPEIRLGIDIEIGGGRRKDEHASCLLDIAFHRADTMQLGAVVDLGPPVPRQPGQPLGTALDGAGTKVSEEHFIVGVLESAKSKPCASVLKEGWVDLPLRLSSGLRGKLTFELPSRAAESATNAEAHPHR